MQKTFPNYSKKKNEGELILKKLQSSDDLVLLDEHGKTYSSISYADWIQKKMNAGTKPIDFCHWRTLRIFGGCLCASQW